jgi:hypothetical protein
MRLTADIASSWLVWGSAYNLPEPHYVTLSMARGMPSITMQLNSPDEVAEWARYLRTDMTTTTSEDKRFDHATYRTGDYEIDLYCVTALDLRPVGDPETQPEHNPLTCELGDTCPYPQCAEATP